MNKQSIARAPVIWTAAGRGGGQWNKGGGAQRGEKLQRDATFGGAGGRRRGPVFRRKKSPPSRNTRSFPLASFLATDPSDPSDPTAARTDAHLAPKRHSTSAPFQIPIRAHAPTGSSNKPKASQFIGVLRASRRDSKPVAPGQPQRGACGANPGLSNKPKAWRFRACRTDPANAGHPGRRWYWRQTSPLLLSPAAAS